MSGAIRAGLAAFRSAWASVGKGLWTGAKGGATGQGSWWKNFKGFFSGGGNTVATNWAGMAPEARQIIKNTGMIAGSTVFGMGVGAGISGGGRQDPQLAANQQIPPQYLQYQQFQHQVPPHVMFGPQYQQIYPQYYRGG